MYCTVHYKLLRRTLRHSKTSMLAAKRKRVLNYSPDVAYATRNVKIEKSGQLIMRFLKKNVNNMRKIAFFSSDIAVRTKGFSQNLILWWRNTFWCVLLLTQSHFSLLPNFDCISSWLTGPKKYKVNKRFNFFCS